MTNKEKQIDIHVDIPMLSPVSSNQGARMFILYKYFPSPLDLSNKNGKWACSHQLDERCNSWLLTLAAFSCINEATIFCIIGTVTNI
ncbi:hypothetical protein COCMIDRAFT_110743 [Bipolaris oryzae ATCC 44560]|uniref:Uncharacterized protein n=1 Tax=Bipolaris oryzae ATCC 44560 TaxID=930090 RepID=W6YW23_COCMI|nr:uncharacterized protein COCMIDRAFT_110743 [Bipolaris oryzae ATCC 44560]EUC39724.1 hypothetical protein COCMIDRAFT_110743 [Bipolaris oryzae ATCC 44560]